MRNVEEVALYAVLLKEAARNHHTSAQSLLDDFACDEEHHITFAAMLAHEQFTDLDWEFVILITDHPTEVKEIARIVYCEQELVVEAEALLHAAGVRTRALWASEINERWRQVEDAMGAWERENLTTSVSDVHQIAKNVFMAARPRCTEEDFCVLFERELHEPVDMQEWVQARKHSGMYTGEDVDGQDPLTAFINAARANPVG